MGLLDVGSIDYWRGVVKARIGETPESVIDSLGKYLDAYPDGMFADDAVSRLESAQARKLSENDSD